jgi:hypothetical protein
VRLHPKIGAKNLVSAAAIRRWDDNEFHVFDTCKCMMTAGGQSVSSAIKSSIWLTSSRTSSNGTGRTGSMLVLVLVLGSSCCRRTAAAAVGGGCWGAVYCEGRTAAGWPGGGTAGAKYGCRAAGGCCCHHVEGGQLVLVVLPLMVVQQHSGVQMGYCRPCTMYLFLQRSWLNYSTGCTRLVYNIIL